MKLILYKIIASLILTISIYIYIDIFFLIIKKKNYLGLNKENGSNNVQTNTT